MAKRWLEVVSCDPCPASTLPSPPPSQTPAASFFPGATLPSYIPPPPPSTTSPPPCWFPDASLPSYIPPPPPSTTSQSCRQKASEINDLVVDGDFDILLMTETWLYANGDEANITEMTPSGYLFHSFPRIGRRGGGIAIMFKSACLTPFLCILCRSARWSRWNCGYQMIAHQSR